MRADRWLFAVAVLSLCTPGAPAQARPQGVQGSMSDTLPEAVVQRTFDAWKRHDLDAMYANYDSVFTYERFGDPAGSHQVRRDDNLRKTKADTAVMRIINGQSVVLVRSDVYGAFVIQEWTETFADGRAFKHFELFEVRRGKIVREIEGDILLKPSR
jgi:ketosteroid isomerase-like protein